MKYELPSIKLRVIEENNYLKLRKYLNDMQCGDTINKLNLDDLEYVKKLQQENKQLKKDIKNIIKILNKNCDDLEATEEEFDSLDRWQELQVVELEKGSYSNAKD